MSSKIRPNSDNTGLMIRVKLTGAAKDSVDLDIGHNGFCINVKGDAFDTKMASCWPMAPRLMTR